MKKLFILILALCVAVLAFTACGEGNDAGGDNGGNNQGTNQGTNQGGNEGAGNNQSGGASCTEHVDGNRDGACDTCGGNLPNRALGVAVFEQLKQAKTISFKLEIAIDSDEVKNVYDSDEEEFYVEESYAEVVVDFFVTVAFGDGESRALQIVNLTKGREGAEEEWKTLNEAKLYIIDGVFYRYDEEGYYEIFEDLGAEYDRIVAIAEAVASGFEVSSEEMGILANYFGELVNTSFNVVDNVGSFELDVKSIVLSLREYINGIDLQTKTVGELVNDLIGLVTEEVTAADVLAFLEEKAALTVNEALAELDVFLTEKTGKTLQQLYDDTVADERVLLVITNAVNEYVKATMPEDDGAEQAAADMLAAIVELDIAAAVAEMGVGELTVYDFVASAVAAISGSVDEDGAPAYPTAAELFETVELMLEMTLAEFDENMGVSIFGDIKREGDCYTVNELYLKGDIAFSGMLELDSLDIDFKLDYDYLDPTDYGTGTPSSTSLTIAAKLELYGILDTVTDIAIPTDAIILNSDLAYRYYYVDGNVGGDALYLFIDEDGVYTYDYASTVSYVVEGKYYELSFDAPFSSFAYNGANRYTVESKYVYFTDNNDKKYAAAPDSDFIFTINTETNAIIIVEMPRPIFDTAGN